MFQKEIYDHVIFIIRAIIENACLILKNKIPDQFIEVFHLSINYLLEEHLVVVEEQLGLENDDDIIMEALQELLQEPPGTPQCPDYSSFIYFFESVLPIF
jgi:hypothetical protein